MDNVIPEEVKRIVSLPRRITLWLVEELRWIFRVIYYSVDRFYWDNGFSRAASLAYTTLLSLVPVMALVFGLLASFAVSNEHLPEVRSFILRQFVPNLEAVNTVLQYVSTFSEKISGLNALVIAFLVITAILLINSIEYMLNEIWQVYEPRSISNRIAIFCAVIVIGPVLAISAFYFTKFRVEPLLTGLTVDSWFFVLYQILLPFLFDFAAFAMLYYMVPKAPVRFRSVIFGAFLAALLFGLAKAGFALYIENFASYDKVYSTLAAIPIFLFWLYLAWSIVLFGAESCYQAQHLPRHGKVWKRTVMSVGDAGMVLAMQALLMITRAFVSGQKLPNDLEIAETLGCSTVVLKPALTAMEKAGIIVAGDSRDMPRTLLRSPDAIKLCDVQTALFGGRTAMHFPAEMAKLFQNCSGGSPGNLTLAEVVGVVPIPEKEPKAKQ